MKPVRASILGLAGMILVISGCTTSGNRNVPSGHAAVSCSSCGDSRFCRPPMWYWSHGHYVPIIDDYLTSYAAKSCAVKSLSRTEMKQSSNNDDFRQGYIQSYVDIAMGSRGIIPAVPPPKYWKTNNRSVRGHQKADQWFAGYRDGLSQSGIKLASEQTTIPTSHEQYQNNSAYHGNYY